MIILFINILMYLFNTVVFIKCCYKGQFLITLFSLQLLCFSISVTSIILLISMPFYDIINIGISIVSIVTGFAFYFMFLLELTGYYNKLESEPENKSEIKHGKSDITEIT